MCHPSYFLLLFKWIFYFVLLLLKTFQECSEEEIGHTEMGQMQLIK
jgi:hypothetical protein